MSNVKWLTSPIHKNYIRRFLKDSAYDWEADQSVVESLIIMPDDTIIGVKTSAISSYLDHKKVVNLSLGYEKLSKDKKDLFIKDNESFYKFLALNVDYEDGMNEEEEEEEG